MRAINLSNLLSAAVIATAAIISNQAATAAPTGLDLGSVSKSTPYDTYMSPVKSVLKTLDKRNEPSYKEVCNYLRTARRFRYSFKTAYVANSPSTTEKSRSGDCKDKSLWLVDRMDDANVRFVIGKLKTNSKLKHAWVLWQNDGEWFILDPTHRTRPLPVDSVKKGQYVPYYSYSRTKTFRHDPTRPVFADAGRKVAEKQEAIASGEDVVKKSSKRRKGWSLFKKNSKKTASAKAAKTKKVAKASTKKQDRTAAKEVKKSNDKEDRRIAFAKRLQRRDGRSAI